MTYKQAESLKNGDRIIFDGDQDHERDVGTVVEVYQFGFKVKWRDGMVSNYHFGDVARNFKKEK